MSATFPFGFGASSSIYLLLYLVTWIAHFFLVSTVVVGAFYTALRAWRGPTVLSRDLGGALPLVLGLAITAGVAPLLFVQILYRDAFYTANLLLYVRFLAVVPALLVCFYLFYFIRTARAQKLSRAARTAVLGFAWLLTIFIGISWIELHTLSMAPSTWVERYAAGEHSNLSMAVAWRGSMFLAMAIAMTAVFALGLGVFHQRANTSASPMAGAASAASLAALAFAALYGRELSEPVIGVLTSGSVLVHVIGFAFGAIASAVLWAVAAAKGEVSPTLRRALVASALLWLWSTAIVREAIRADALDLGALAASHQESFANGGKITFVLFGLVNVLAIVWCGRLVWRVWRDAVRTDESPSSKDESSISSSS